MVVARTALTLETFLALPEEQPALEFEDGQVTQKVSPKLPHSALQGELVTLLNNALTNGRFARAFPELRMTTSGRSRVPDVVVYRWSRIPRGADGSMALDATTLPDVAIEIRSPEQSLQSQFRRCRSFVDEGVPLALAIDPLSRRIFLFVRNEPERELSATEPISFDSLKPGFALTPAEIFQALDLD